MLTLMDGTTQCKNIIRDKIEKYHLTFTRQVKVPLWLSFTLSNTKVSVYVVDPCWTAVPAMGPHDSGTVQLKEGAPAVIVAEQERVSESIPAVREELDGVTLTEDMKSNKDKS